VWRKPPRAGFKSPSDRGEIQRSNCFVGKSRGTPTTESKALFPSPAKNRSARAIGERDRQGAGDRLTLNNAAASQVSEAHSRVNEARCERRVRRRTHLGTSEECVGYRQKDRRRPMKSHTFVISTELQNGADGRGFRSSQKFMDRIKDDGILVLLRPRSVAVRDHVELWIRVPSRKRRCRHL